MKPMMASLNRNEGRNRMKRRSRSNSKMRNSVEEKQRSCLRVLADGISLPEGVVMQNSK